MCCGRAVAQLGSERFQFVVASPSGRARELSGGEFKVQSGYVLVNCLRFSSVVGERTAIACLNFLDETLCHYSCDAKAGPVVMHACQEFLTGCVNERDSG